jgi:4-hydroxy-3-polyprenylbenzoate decarboxylase
MLSDDLIHHILIMDGTRKLHHTDLFDRPVPNVIVSDNQTINAIDEKWNLMGLGSFIKSPSLSLLNLVLNNEAQIKE